MMKIRVKELTTRMRGTQEIIKECNSIFFARKCFLPTSSLNSFIYLFILSRHFHLHWEYQRDDLNNWVRVWWTWEGRLFCELCHFCTVLLYKFPFGSEVAFLSTITGFYSHVLENFLIYKSILVNVNEWDVRHFSGRTTETDGRRIFLNNCCWCSQSDVGEKDNFWLNFIKKMWHIM